MWRYKEGGSNTGYSRMIFNKFIGWATKNDLPFQPTSAQPRMRASRNRLMELLTSWHYDKLYINLFLLNPFF